MGSHKGRVEQITSSLNEMGKIFTLAEEICRKNELYLLMNNPENISETSIGVKGEEIFGSWMKFYQITDLMISDDHNLTFGMGKASPGFFQIPVLKVLENYIPPVNGTLEFINGYSIYPSAEKLPAGTNLNDIFEEEIVLPKNESRNTLCVALIPEFQNGYIDFVLGASHHFPDASHALKNRTGKESAYYVSLEGDVQNHRFAGEGLTPITFDSVGTSFFNKGKLTGQYFQWSSIFRKDIKEYAQSENPLFSVAAGLYNDDKKCTEIGGIMSIYPISVNTKTTSEDIKNKIETITQQVEVFQS